MIIEVMASHLIEILHIFILVWSWVTNDDHQLVEKGEGRSEA